MYSFFFNVKELGQALQLKIKPFDLSQCIPELICYIF